LSTLLLVRHGQARLFSEDYDRLSTQGSEQLVALARAWLADGMTPERVWCGTLRRQRESAAAVRDVFVDAGQPWPEFEVDAGLDEYPAELLMPRLLDDLSAAHPELARTAACFEAAADERSRYRYFHRLLEALMAHWVAGSSRAELPLSWEEFSARVRRTFSSMQQATGRGGTAVAFTSGGPIGVSVQTVLEAPDIKAMELNWRILNGSVTQYTFSGARISLDRFNDTRHLPARLLSYR